MNNSVKLLFCLLPLGYCSSCHSSRATAQKEITLQVADSLWQARRTTLSTIEFLNSVQTLDIAVETYKDSIGHSHWQWHSSQQLSRNLNRTDTLHTSQHTRHHYLQRQLYHQQKELRRSSTLMRYFLLCIALLIAFFLWRIHKLTINH